MTLTSRNNSKKTLAIPKKCGRTRQNVKAKQLKIKKGRNLKTAEEGEIRAKDGFLVSIFSPWATQLNPTEGRTRQNVKAKQLKIKKEEI